MIQIVDLTAENLEGAVAVNDLIFKVASQLPRRSLSASLDPSIAIGHDDMKEINFRKYWVAVSDDNVVVGTIGLYTFISDEHEADWVNWYCVHPQFRGQGLGRKLLEKALVECQKRNKPYLRLWTTDGENEKDAQFLYDKMGFIITKTEPSEDPTYANIIYRERKLN